MATMSIRNISPDVKQGLRVLAARNGRSMEEEVRRILGEAVLGQRQERMSREEIERDVRSILTLGRRPEEPFDQKAIIDAVWDASE